MARTIFKRFAGRLNTTAPSSPKTGEVLWASNRFQVYNGTGWVSIALTSTSTSTTSTSTSTS